MELDILKSGEIKIHLIDNFKYGNVEEFKSEIYLELKERSLQVENYYILKNGRIMSDYNFNSPHTITLVPRLLGGKGGFGSMLRSIGAQIEKTTNRDACRDLSGRRLRDLDEEQRLKKWFAKQAERETQKKEAKKRKLEKAKEVVEGPPLKKINDQEFLQKKEEIEESVYEAVEVAFSQNSQSESGAISDSSEAESDPAGKISSSGGTFQSSSQDSNASTSSLNQHRQVKKFTLFDEDLDSSSSSDSDNDEEKGKEVVQS